MIPPTRAQGLVADAVTAVIAGTVHSHLNRGRGRSRDGLPPIPHDEVRAAAAAAVEQLRADGWHITIHPLPITRQETRR